MKRRLRLLSIISAAAISMSMVFAACSAPEVAEHDHIWNDGEVTTEATCHSEGVKTYTCTVEGCGQTKTEPIGMTEHKWDGGTVKTPAKCNELGVMTYKCTNEGCTKTKDVDIPKSGHHFGEYKVTEPEDFYNKGQEMRICSDCSTEEFRTRPAQADFGDMYSAEEWKYGAAVSYETGSGEITFTAATKEGDVYKADGVEIGKGSVSVDAGKVAVIEYDFGTDVPAKIEAQAAVSFKGSAGALTGYIVYGGAEQVVTSEAKAEFTFESEEIDVEAGGVLALVLVNGGSQKAEGALTFTLRAPCVHVWDEGALNKPATCKSEGKKTYTCVNEDCGATKEGPVDRLEYGNLISDFDTDFELKDNGLFNNWSVGKVDYDFVNQTFDYTVITAKNGDNSGYENTGEGQPYMNIKGDWAAINGMAGFAYKFAGDADAHIDLRILGIDGNKFNVRYSLEHAGVKGTPEWVNGGSDIALAKDISVSANDVLYILVDKDGDSKGDQCYYSFVLSGEQKQTVPEVANFYDDFGKANNNWVYGYATGYNFDTNAFTFNPIEANGEGNYQVKDGDNNLEIKKDFVLTEYGGRDLAVGYTVPAGYGNLTVNVIFDGTNENTQIAPRILTVREGATQSAEFFSECESKQNWNVSHDVAVAEGDRIYVILFPKGDSDYKQGKLQIVIKGVQSGEPSEPAGQVLANFHDDFTTDEGGNWVYGYATDYNWDTNGFTFHGDLTANPGEGQWNTSDNKIKIKNDYFESDDGKDVTVGYKVQQGETVGKIEVTFNGSDNPNANPRYAIRVVIMGADGTVKACKIDDTGATEATWTYTSNDITAEAGDTVYVVFFHKDGWKQGKLQIIISGKAAQQPTESKQVANFHDDFHDNTVTDSNWLYGYTKDYDYDEHTFTFTALTEYADGGWKTSEKDILLKNDYFEAEASSLAIGYKVPAGYTKLNVKVEYSSNDEANPRYAARIVVVHADGSRNFIDYVGGKANRDWVADKDADVTEGDIIYVVMSYEGQGYKQGKLQIVITEK